MFAAETHHSKTSESSTTIVELVLKPPRARLVHSRGDGFGSHIDRLVNVAYETHRSFDNLIKTRSEIIEYLRQELEQSYFQYQFTIIVGKEFDFDISSCSHFAEIEHVGLRILIFSSIGCSYSTTSTEEGNNEKSFAW